MNRKAPEIPAWEWLIAGIGMLITLTMIGFFAWHGLSEKRPPEFVMRIDSVRGNAVSFTVENRGDVTAAQVVVEAVSTDPPHPTLSFDFVPARSSRSGVLLLEVPEPARARLAIRSFLIP